MRPPPWWPANEPWPMRRMGAPWRSTRARFARRVALTVMFVVLAGVSGTIAVVWTAAARLGVVTVSSRAGALIVVGGAMLGAVATAAMVIGATRRFGMSLASVMDGANRVAGGDYDVRVGEHGSPPMRALARAFNTMTTRLAEHDRVRRDLMADVAHELRTPLTVIQGKLEGLVDGVYARDDRQLGELLDETRVLARLVEDLRILAHSEAGALTLEKEPTDIGALVRDAVRAIADEASARGVAAIVDAPTDLPSLAADGVRIRQVITNLLTNALRHTPAGGSVAVRLRAADHVVEIDVRDSGEGMTPDELAHAFDRFHKGRASRGSGLGLTIARNLVVAHGGDLRLSSERGRGTTATVTLPIL